jgi:hypothetical protein
MLLHYEVERLHHNKEALRMRINTRSGSHVSATTLITTKLVARDNVAPAGIVRDAMLT